MFFVKSCSIAVQRVLFDFNFERLFNKRLPFPPLYRDFFRLLLATSKDYWVPKMLVALGINKTRFSFNRNV